MNAQKVQATILIVFPINHLGIWSFVYFLVDLVLCHVCNVSFPNVLKLFDHDDMI